MSPVNNTQKRNSKGQFTVDMPEKVSNKQIQLREIQNDYKQRLRARNQVFSKAAVGEEKGKRD